MSKRWCERLVSLCVLCAGVVYFGTGAVAQELTPIPEARNGGSVEPQIHFEESALPTPVVDVPTSTGPRESLWQRLIIDAENFASSKFYQTPLQRTHDNAPSIDERRGGNSLKVCGTDTRTQVTSTTAAPWSGLCRLEMTFPNGLYIGTGFMINSRTVMTAGHCVFDPATKKWATKIRVIPGKNGSAESFGSVTVATSGLKAPTQWTSTGDSNYDFGAIELPTSTTFLTRVFKFAYKNETTAVLTKSSNVWNTAGYPGDKANGTCWTTFGSVTGASSTKLSYVFDTYGGQSGSPVWGLYSDGVRRVVGIHVAGQDSPCTNYATRVNSTLYSFMAARP